MEEPQARRAGVPVGRLARAAAALAAVALLAACGGGGERGPGDRAAARDAAGAGAGGSTAGGSPTTGGRVQVTPYVADELLRTVVRVQDDGSRHIVRWPAGSEVRIEVAGTPTADDLAVLDQAIGRLGALITVPVRRVERDGNVVMHFVAKDRWAEIVDDPAVDLTASGWTYTYSEATDERPRDAGALREATVVVDTEVSQAARNRVIAHELGHALGLGHTTCPASLMHDGDLARPLWSPAPLDTELLRVLYSAPVEPGMTAEELDAVLDRSGTIGPVCGAIDWQLVHHGGTSYFCVAGAGPQPCVAYRGPVEPVQPVAAPDGWVVDGRFADYDPGRWEAFRFGEQRLLCERSAAEYRPCAVYDGVTPPDYPVSEPAYWTDGRYVYDAYPG